ncbi:Flp family type IVb pilin [bacterium]|nr:Flp family type IVb pilin [bacterium]
MFQTLLTLYKFYRDDEGASAVEYGLVVGLIAVALILVLGALGGGLEGLFQDAADCVSGSAECAAEE